MNIVLQSQGPDASQVGSTWVWGEGGSFPNTGEFPARAELFSAKPFTTDKFLLTVTHSLRIGRTFQSSRKWAVIEIPLNPALSELWAELFENPDLDLIVEISCRFANVQKSIEQSLLRTHPLF